MLNLCCLVVVLFLAVLVSIMPSILVLLGYFAFCCLTPVICIIGLFNISLVNAFVNFGQLDTLGIKIALIGLRLSGCLVLCDFFIFFHFFSPLILFC